MGKQRNITDANPQSCSLTCTDDCTFTLDTHKAAGRDIPTHTYSYKHSKHTYSSATVINCSASPLSRLVERPTIDQAFFSWLKPTVFREFMCDSVFSLLPLPCPEEKESGINKPPRVCLARFRNSSRTGTHRLQCTTAQECWYTGKGIAEGQHIIEEILSGLCSFLKKSVLLDVSLPWVEHHQIFIYIHVTDMILILMKIVNSNKQFLSPFYV